MGSQQGKNKTPTILITGLDNAGKSALIRHLNPRKYRRKLVLRIDEDFLQTQTSLSHSLQDDKFSHISELSPSNKKSPTKVPSKEKNSQQLLSSGVSLGLGGSETANSIQIETFTKLRLGGDFTVFDLQPHNYRQRDLWELFYQDSSAIVFVIDASDRLRIQVVKNELDMFLDHAEIKNQGQPILFLANKFDKPSSLDESYIIKSLNLEALIDRMWTLRKCSSLTGEGILDAFQWLNQTLKDQRKRMKIQRRNSVGRAIRTSSGTRGRSGSLGRLSLKSSGMMSEQLTNLHAKDAKLANEGSLDQNFTSTYKDHVNSKKQNPQLANQELSDETTAFSPQSSLKQRMDLASKNTPSEKAGRRTLALTSEEKKRAKAALRRSFAASCAANSRGINSKLMKSSKIVMNSESQPFIIQEIKHKQ